MPKKRRKKQVNLRIEEELWNRLKQLADEHDTAVIELIEGFCHYGLLQQLDFSKGSVFINVESLDRPQSEQNLKTLVESTVKSTIGEQFKSVVETNVKSLIDEQLQFKQLLDKLQHLTEEDCKWLKALADHHRKKQKQEKQSNENKPQDTKAIESHQQASHEGKKDFSEGLTDRELAEILKVNPSTVYRWSTGETEPRNKEHAAMIDKYEVRGDRWYPKTKSG